MINITKIKKIKILKFRGLKNVEIEFGNRLTVICGKNGTSKSTILGIVAQAFSFEKDYSQNPPDESLKEFKTLTNSSFKSPFSDHFRFSPTYDKAGDMDVALEIYDGASKKLLDRLKLGTTASKDRPTPRPVLRNNDAIEGNNNTSRNVTHPVIYLNMNRFIPITSRVKYEADINEYIQENKDRFKSLSNQLLVKSSGSNITSTKGTIPSSVVHGTNYDHDSVSVGEDNVGQLLQALFSFDRLQQEYKNYHGGILLIDEVDAGLFPKAQIEFIKILCGLSKKLNLQIIFTSHSPILIEEIYKLTQHKENKKEYKVAYLTDSFGSIEVKNNLSWAQIEADLRVTTICVADEINLPKINVYFEDLEAYDFFSALITNRKESKILNKLKDISLGCGMYTKLLEEKVSEFYQNSIIVLDGDVTKVDKFSNVIKLPTQIPPDQLLFEFLFNLDPADEYWQNSMGFTRPVFVDISNNIIFNFKINDEMRPINLADIIKKNKPNAEGKKGEEGKIRDLFKKFSVHQDIQKIMKTVQTNPYRRWIKDNPDQADIFREKFKTALTHVLINGHNVNSAKINAYFESQL